MMRDPKWFIDECEKILEQYDQEDPDESIFDYRDSHLSERGKAYLKKKQDYITTMKEKLICAG